ncbi:MAG: DUF5049 domain-containing protein [Bacteroidales bacterium]|nr:DUF5049 domain-containing protein [Bacteroidales bacterium]
MSYPSEELKIPYERAEYKPGMRIELLEMNDPQAPPIGTQGTVLGVDDVGSIIVDWDNGCGLNVAFVADKVKILHHMSDQIREQILEIRATGETNMFDIYTVQRMANDREFYELVIYLEEHPDEYWNFILTGDPAAGSEKMEVES